VIPGEVLAHIEAFPRTELPGILAREHECQGSKFHSPRPMVVHPFPMPHTPGEKIYLCGTCSDNVRLLISLEAQGEVPWTVKRCFGNLVRAVAAAAKKETNDA
jgi:hypothetical protein